MDLHLRGGDPLKYRGDVLILSHFSDIRPLTGTVACLDWTFNASISNLWKARSSLLDFGGQTLLPTQGKFPFPYVVLLGLGRREKFSEDLRQEIYRLGLMAALGMQARRIGCEGVPVSDNMDMSVIDDFSRTVGKLGDTPLKNAALFISSPELLAEARTVYVNSQMDGDATES
ncbi:hypothetical protein EP232_03525, partial [bacterium]